MYSHDALTLTKHTHTNTHRSSGSGFVYDARGYILTNAHVVEAAASRQEGRDSSICDGLDSRSASGKKSSRNATGVRTWDSSVNHDSSRRNGSSDSSRNSSSRQKKGTETRQPPAVLTVTLQDGRMLPGRVVCLDRCVCVCVLCMFEMLIVSDLV